MDEDQEPAQPAPRRRRSRRPAPGSPELKVVGGADAALDAVGPVEPAQAAKPPRQRQAKRKVLDRHSIGSLFRRQPIEGTERAVREASMNDVYDMLADEANKELDDREFAVRAVHRQLAGDEHPGIDGVRAWSDDQLLAGARAMLSFPPLHVLVDGAEQEPDPDEVIAIPDPLTFPAFREALASGPKRHESKLADTARRIAELGIPKMASLFDSGTMAAIRAAQAGPLAALGPSSAFGSTLAALAKSPALDMARSPVLDAFKTTAGLDIIARSPALNMKLPDLDFTKGIAERARALTDTAGIAEGLSKLQATTLAAERLAKPIEFTMPESRLAPLTMPAIAPYHPEVDAIDSLGGRIEAMADNQAKADREALEVMTAQSELIREQGAAVQGVIAEVRGLRDDQRWPNRAVIIGAFLGGALLVVGVLTAVPIVKELLGL